MKAFHDSDGITIYRGDNRDVMPALPADSIDLTITSPPYNCGKSYDSTADRVSWDEYWKRTRAWLVEAFRLTKPGGRLAVNLPWWMGSKPRRDVPFEFQKLALDLGWIMLDKIIWVKGDPSNIHTSGGFGGGGCGWGTYLSPSCPSIRCASEPIIVFAKGSRGRGVISGEGRGACVRGDMTKAEWMEWTLDVWFVRGAGSREHPAIFPDEIPKRLIKLYTFPGDVVLDPHNGIGTTTTTARAVNRLAIGIEHSAKYCKIAAAC